jgi:hypothetical protein
MIKAAPGWNNKDGLKEVKPTSSSPIENERAELAAHGIDGDGQNYVMLYFSGLNGAGFKAQMTPLNLHQHEASRVTLEIYGKTYNGQAVRETFDRNTAQYPTVAVLVRNLTQI